LLANFRKPFFNPAQLHSAFKATAAQKIFMKRVIAVLVIVACVFGTRASAQEKSTNAKATATSTGSTSTSKIKLTVVRVDSEEIDGENGRGTNAVDGNPDTFWHTQWQDASPECPHEIVIKLENPTSIKGFTYLPRQDEEENGTIKDYEFYVSDDGKEFGKPVKKGSLETDKRKKTVAFEPVKCSFIKLRALSEINDAAWTSAAEIGVVPAE